MWQWVIEEVTLLISKKEKLEKLEMSEKVEVRKK
jgi:hypothetical protein